VIEPLARTAGARTGRRRCACPGFRPVAGRSHTGPMRRAHRLAPVAVVLASIALLLLAAGTAAADVVVQPDHVEPGSRDVTLVFRVTDDDPAAPITRLQVFLPTGRPLVGVTAPAQPGWTVQLTTTVLPRTAPTVDGPVREVVSSIEWSATGPRSTTGTDLPVRVALMPDGAGPVRFRATQTDSGGRTVEWSDTWAEGTPPPAHGSLALALGGAARPPVAVSAQGDHHGDHDAAAVAASARQATSGGVAVTVGGLLAVADVGGGATVLLGRRQRNRFGSLSASADRKPERNRD